MCIVVAGSCNRQARLSQLALAVLCSAGISFGANSASAQQVAINTPLTGGFVGVDWRVMGIGGHVSHGPGFQVGAVLWRYLRVGLAGFARPGPINPATFEATPVDGSSYLGNAALSLRSDGAFFGLMIGPSFDIADVIAIEVPVTFGQAAFGFYLTGDDRDTPDGERVSSWENRMLDGRDSSVAFGIDVGLRLNIIASSWARPYIGGHYLGTIGYDAYVTDNYGGPSFVAGVQFGRFR